MKTLNTQDTGSEPIKIIVAGEAGNGKTTLAATIEKGLGEKVIVISAEAGLLSIRGANIDYIELQRKWDDTKKVWLQVPKTERIAHLVEIYTWLMKPETMAKYKWVFIDSLTEINQNLLELVESLDDFAGPKNNIKKYGEIATRMRSLCKTFRDIPHYSVVFSALTKTVTDNDNKITMKIDVIGQFSDQLPALFDELLYLGVTEEIDPMTGKNSRKLLTAKTDKITFPKDRCGKLDRLEPADLSVIVNKIRGAITPQVSNV